MSEVSARHKVTSEVTSTHHTGYTVSDLDQSLGFYRDLLGCEVVATQYTEPRNVGTAHLCFLVEDLPVELFQPPKRGEEA